MTSIFDKTEKGREEIATRKYALPPRLRTLLVLIDGKHTQDELLKQVASLGLSEKNVTELHDRGFIAIHHDHSSTDVIRTASATSSSPKTEPDVPAAAPLPATSQTAASTAPAQAEETKIQALYAFYTSTIKTAIGLRGYALQLKVERARSIEEFQSLRRPYLEAVQDAQGTEMARSLRDQLDKLLFAGPPADRNLPA